MKYTSICLHSGNTSDNTRAEIVVCLIALPYLRCYIIVTDTIILMYRAVSGATVYTYLLIEGVCAKATLPAGRRLCAVAAYCKVRLSALEKCPRYDNKHTKHNSNLC